jgi:hypothetical protein
MEKQKNKTQNAEELPHLAGPNSCSTPFFRSSIRENTKAWDRGKQKKIKQLNKATDLGVSDRDFENDREYQLIIASSMIKVHRQALYWNPRA